MTDNQSPEIVVTVSCAADLAVAVKRRGSDELSEYHVHAGGQPITLTIAANQEVIVRPAAIPPAEKTCC